MHLPKQLAHEVRSRPGPPFLVAARRMSEMDGWKGKIMGEDGPSKTSSAVGLLSSMEEVAYLQREVTKFPVSAWVHRGSGSFVFFLLIHVHQHLSVLKKKSLQLLSLLKTKLLCVYVSAPTHVHTHTHVL